VNSVPLLVTTLQRMLHELPRSSDLEPDS
jgi:hypothetical protein